MWCILDWGGASTCTLYACVEPLPFRRGKRQVIHPNTRFTHGQKRNIASNHSEDTNSTLCSVLSTPPQIIRVHERLTSSTLSSSSKPAVQKLVKNDTCGGSPTPVSLPMTLRSKSGWPPVQFFFGKRKITDVATPWNIQKDQKRVPTGAEGNPHTALTVIVHPNASQHKGQHAYSFSCFLSVRPH